MAKSVFTAGEIAHVWAHKLAPEGRKSSGRDASFDGDAFYSYATVIARHGTHNGKPYIIRDCSSFSSFTGKVQNKLSRAIPPDAKVFVFNNGSRGQSLNPTPQQMFDSCITEADECREKEKRARSNKAYWAGNQAMWLGRAQDVNEFFDLGHTVDEGAMDALRKRVQEAEAAETLRRATEQEDMRRRHRKHYDEWIAGTEPRILFNSGLFPTAFRVEAPYMVSSHGVRVSLIAAYHAIRFVRIYRTKGWKRNGHQFAIDGYHLDSVSENGVIAGCHRVSWDEIDRIAPLVACALGEVAA